MIAGAVDIGLNGGLATLNSETGYWKAVRMPTNSVPWKGKARKVIDPNAVLEFFDSCEADEVVVEEQQAFPSQGSVSMFRLGEQYGMVRGLLAGAAIDYRVISPRRWKGDLKLSSNKEQSFDLAKVLFGNEPVFNVKANDGLVEALLLCHWLITEGIL